MLARNVLLRPFGPRVWFTLRRASSLGTSTPDSSSVYSLPWQYLRAVDESNYDQTTKQRLDVEIDEVTGKLRNTGVVTASPYSVVSCSFDGDDYSVTWSDGLSSRYSAAWLDGQLSRWKQDDREDRVLWINLTERDLRKSPILKTSFSDLLTDQGMSKGLRTLYQYGILLVTDTPIADNGAGIAALGASLGGGRNKQLTATSVLANYRKGGSEIMLPQGTDGPLRTLYGTVWSTSSSGQAEGASVADSAYTSNALPLHTDMTYQRDPPGLQIFTMVQPAREGGESVFADGFAVAERLRSRDPESFRILSSTIRTYRCIDRSMGWHLEASGPVIKAEQGRITSIRHNDLDRLPDLPPKEASTPDEIDRFYADLRRAHAAWDRLLCEDEFRLKVQLKPGETMVVANQVGFQGCVCFFIFDDASNFSNIS